jgi:hypothetical protein
LEKLGSPKGRKTFGVVKKNGVKENQNIEMKDEKITV